jgi:hypothetical protein
VDARRDQRYESQLPIKLDVGDGVLRNVSASGVYFVTEADLKPGQALKFTLEFSSIPIGLITARCEARVVRVEPHGATKGVGVVFESIEFHRVAEPSG